MTTVVQFIENQRLLQSYNYARQHKEASDRTVSQLTNKQYNQEIRKLNPFIIWRLQGFSVAGFAGSTVQ
ncbi:hypothetical protein INT45_009368 [Circinella minor]|uniref:Uncharacterized protein n=1 Tax=Circinella minor TaxID=1195481 RepID=A0A8H7S764_9FUNG|nr:hypothetical protein INT45_009368 [Circinella minor]